MQCTRRFESCWYRNNIPKEFVNIIYIRMYKLNISEYTRRSSIASSPVSSLIEKYHTNPKIFFDIQYKKNNNNTNSS